MEGYKYEVQVELTPGDPVISAQVCLERKWGTQGNLNTNTATVTSWDVWSDIFFLFWIWKLVSYLQSNRLYWWFVSHERFPTFDAGSFKCLHHNLFGAGNVCLKFSHFNRGGIYRILNFKIDRWMTGVQLSIDRSISSD